MQAVAFEHVRHNQCARNIHAHLRAPECQLGVLGLSDVLNRRRGGQHLGVGERVGQGLQAEVVIRVAVADVDGGQVLTAGADLVHDVLGLSFAKLGIDQNGVLVTAHQHRRHRENRRSAGVVHVQREGRGRGASLCGKAQRNGTEEQTTQG